MVHTRPVTATVTIKHPPRAVYELFRDFSRLPEFMTYLDSVKEDGELSTWTAKLPVVGKVSWKARIIEDVPGELLAWRSEPGSLVRTRGRVTFTKAPGRESTEVRVEMELGVLGRRPTGALARWFASPEVKGDLRRLKQVLETGEVLRSDASAHVRPHAAQPAGDARPAPDFFIPHNPNVRKEVVS
ncbi:MAG: SRPBCC family protein [bacterium]